MTVDQAANKTSKTVSLAEAFAQMTRELGYAHIAKRRLRAKLENGEFDYEWQDADGNVTRNRLPAGCSWGWATFIWARSAVSLYHDAPGALTSPGKRMAYFGPRVDGRPLPWDPPDQPQTRVMVKRIYAVKVWPRDEPQSGGPKTRQRRAPQIERVLRELPGLYPPDGVVPETVETETVRGRLDEVLADENRRLGLTTPRWDTINRAIRRGK